MSAAWSAEKGWHETTEPAKVCTVCARVGVFRWTTTCDEEGHYSTPDTTGESQS